MSLARAISRGFFLNARLGVNGTKNASRSFGTVGASGRVASDISSLQRRRFQALTAAISANRDPRNAGLRISMGLRSRGAHSSGGDVSYVNEYKIHQWLQWRNRNLNERICITNWKLYHQPKFEYGCIWRMAGL